MKRSATAFGDQVRGCHLIACGLEVWLKFEVELSEYILVAFTNQDTLRTCVRKILSEQPWGYYPFSCWSYLA